MHSERSIATRTRSAGGASGVVYAGAADDAPFFAEQGAAARYEIRGELAVGGMGRVLEAWDSRQSRMLAVKVLLRSEPVALRRFEREARITSRLEHPAIIPVHDVGRLASGEPFYAMKLVHGRSLREAIDDTKTTKERLALIPHVIAIADALAYAHEARVIHRDLKPSNVLVGRFGETVVIDWGLAKDLTAPLDDDAGDASAPSVAPTSERLTVAGTALGTPSYMAPEQARGEAVNERADVYAIGAILYHVLAGRSPYGRATSNDVAKGPPAALEQIAQDVPADLVAIVDKAMARDAEARYPSARELALDLRRFATGQLVAAHTYGFGALLGRWAAKHRLPIGIASLLLVTLGIFAGFSVRRIVRERDRADVANLAADRERQRAVGERDAAERLVAFMISDLRDRLKHLGRLDVLAGVGNEVSAYYDSTAEGGAHTDRASLEQRATALETLGEVEAAKQDVVAARALFDSALAMRRRVLALSDDDAARAAEGELLYRVARFERAQGTVDAASAAAERACAIGDEIAAHEGPSHARGLSIVSRAQSVLATIRRVQGNPDAATEAGTKAVLAARRLLEEQPDSIDALRTLGAALQDAGNVALTRGHLEAPELGESVSVHERIVAKEGADADNRVALASALEHRAFGTRDVGKLDEALRDAMRTRELRAELVDADPENSNWRLLFGQAYDLLCSVKHPMHREEEAIADCKEGIAILSRLAAQSPDMVTVADGLLLVSQRLGWVYFEIERYDEADAAIRPTVALALRFVNRGDGNKLWISRLADSHGFLAEIAERRGKHELAREELAEGLVLLEPLETQSPGYEVQRSLILLRLDLAMAETDRGGVARARELRFAALHTFTTSKGDLSDEEMLLSLAKACAAVAPNADGEERALVERALSSLDAIVVPGVDPKPRQAAMAAARRALAR